MKVSADKALADLSITIPLPAVRRLFERQGATAEDLADFLGARPPRRQYVAADVLDFLAC